MTTNTDEFAPLLASARELARRFAGQADAIDRSGQLPVAHFQALFDAGLLALNIRKEQGGHGAGLAVSEAVVRTIAEGEPSTALVLAMHYIQHGAIAAGAEGGWPEHLARTVADAALRGVALVNASKVDAGFGSLSHGGPPGAAPGVPGVPAAEGRTVARRTDDGWSISGHKKYVTGSRLLRWVNVALVTDETPPRAGNALIPLDAEGVSIVDVWNPLGLRGTGSHDVVFDNVRLPHDHFFARPVAADGSAAPPVRGGGWYLLLVGSVYLGVAQAARNSIVAFANAFSPGSLGAAVATLPRFQEQIGRIEASLAAARHLLQSVARAYDASAGIAQDDYEQIDRDASAARISAINTAIAVTGLALELAGHEGLTASADIVRHHRNALQGRGHGPKESAVHLRLGQQALRGAAFLDASSRQLPA
ncbi:acyl-CoA dehydrogenase [Corticibacter populi]|uniref:Acyl-CoA dehydrogenase n=1 Tax=Corticibacter populi TaxID=1550736 RepID=A0A3M6QSM7_9BURK|nr:acyl-CoA dehydrogenase family protein [Corticibacter populi]RMX05851.1 acyl-CoA dehydrogenase [Corticibacter populi]RZS30831.1 hypothetical protein EV687_3025 [Corticibacter populi]